MHHKISAIVLNYKHPEDTIDCISTLLKSDAGQEVDYYIVDNSAEEKFEKEFKRTFPKVNYLSSPSNTGFAGGNNRAIKKILPTIYTLFFYPYLYLLWTYHFYKKKC